MRLATEGLECSAMAPDASMVEFGEIGVSMPLHVFMHGGETGASQRPFGHPLKRSPLLTKSGDCALVRASHFVVDKQRRGFYARPMDEIDTIENPDTRHKLFEPLVETIRERSRSRRKCTGLDDETFLLAGCLRVIEGSASGREFVQNSSEGFGIDLGVCGFFQALRSPRRRTMVEECSRELYALAEAKLAKVDMLEAFPELQGMAVYAVDGHRISEASHAAKTGEKADTVNTLYQLDIRNGLARPLVVAASAQGQVHEIKAFRQSRIQPAAKGLNIVDRAYIDIAWWSDQASKGSMMLTRTKTNLAPVFRRDLDWDRSVSINQGVISDREAGFNCAHTLRWIEFEDPETGQSYSFITTCWSLPPGLLCMLYLMRWRIEKLYDSFKNKLGQTKAWATTAHSRSMQAHFICMAHNLMTILLAQLASDHGIHEQKVHRKQRRLLVKREQVAAKKALSIHVFHYMIHSSSQITLQFIRSLRNALRSTRPFLETLAIFRRAMNAYI
jgi:hypothetical protein